MNIKLQGILEQLTPFILLGILVALAIGLLLILSYVALAGLFIGALLWAITISRRIFFLKQSPLPTKGRVIEHGK